MSPLTRKVVAIGILVLLILLAAQYAIQPLIEEIAGQRAELAALRVREARLHATIRRPLPKVSHLRQTQAVTAANAAQATQRLQALLAGDAAIAGATVQFGAPCKPAIAPMGLCTQMAVSGGEASISHFLSLVEHREPIIRLRSWQLTSGQGNDNQLHLTGDALAAWRSPS